MSRTFNLFVGGPMDGRKNYMVRHDLTVVKICEKAGLPSNFASDYNISIVPSVIEHEYMRNDIAGNEVFVHSSMSVRDAINKMMGRYRSYK